MNCLQKTKETRKIRTVRNPDDNVVFVALGGGNTIVSEDDNRRRYYRNVVLGMAISAIKTFRDKFCS